MSIIFTDQEIEALIQERKVLSDSWASEFKERENRGFKEHYQDITSEAGNTFRIIVKTSKFNQLTFSVILAVTIVWTVLVLL